MDKSQTIKVIIACVFLLVAGVLILKFAGGSSGIREKDMRSALEEMPVDDLISMRQALAAQVAEANRTRSGEKSEMLLGFEATLANYDAILTERGVDVEALGTPSLAEVPMRKGEEP
jgi:hypothetical protein